jgi:non-homologous end joining protein Ku
MKAIATTNITFGLLNLPVQVVQATEKGSDVSFKMCGPSGQPLTQQYRAADGTTYTRGTASKGIENADKSITPVDSKALTAIAERTKINGLVIEEFTPAIELWKRAHRINGHYYVQMVKKGGNANTMKLFTDRMEARNLCAVVKWTPRTRQEQLVLHAKDGVLHAYAVEFADDVRLPDEAVTAHNSGTYSQAEADMADQLIAAFTKDEPEAMDTMKDEAVAERHALVQQYLSGATVSAPEPQAQQEANAGLMDALAASLAALKDKEKVLA